MKNEVNKLNGTENKIPTRRELYQEIERLKKRIAELENAYSGEYTDEQLKGAVVDIDKWEVWIDLW